MWKNVLNLILLNSGSFFGTISVALFFLLFFLILESNIGIRFLIVLIMSYGFTTIIRFFYFKQRPNPVEFNNIFSKIRASSFPSAHIQRSVAVSYYLFLLFPFSLFVTSFLTILVIYSRIKRRRHYLVDVIAGLFLIILIIFSIEFVFSVIK